MCVVYVCEYVWLCVYVCGYVFVCVLCVCDMCVYVMCVYVVCTYVYIFCMDWVCLLVWERERKWGEGERERSYRAGTSLDIHCGIFLWASESQNKQMSYMWHIRHPRCLQHWNKSSLLPLLSPKSLEKLSSWRRLMVRSSQLPSLKAEMIFLEAPLSRWV